uniref:Glucan endo-1,3-beta-glucosidase n=1 Tax=Anthurium amnicola TaxID=1678845 RepID=A0A1D1YYB8_9ARAE
MVKRHFPLAIVPLLLLLAVATAAVEAAKVGICYGRLGDNLPPPATAVQLITSNNITKVRLFDPDTPTLRAFAGTGVELMVGIPNDVLPSLAAGTAANAARWLQSNVFDSVPAAQVRYLAAGNEVLFGDASYAPHLVPALWNLHRALQAMGLDGGIKLSTPHAASVLATSYPPSGGSFAASVLPTMRPLLEFLAQTGAPFMANVYPFFAHVGDPAGVPISYALFGPDAPVVQDGGLAYTNLFDATVDAFVAAMETEGFPGIAVAVAETGWATAGGEAATPKKAAAFNGNVVSRAVQGVGTPRRPGVAVEVFLFGLFDEDGKPGEEYERHFGVFHHDGRKAYDISFV